MWSGRLGDISATKHRIELLEGSKSIYQPPYRARHRNHDFERPEVGRMLADGLIKLSNAEWASLIVVVSKKDCKLRFCVYYRWLSAVTPKDSYPISKMDECIDSLEDARIFTTINSNRAYWQVEVDEPDRDMTTFTSHFWTVSLQAYALRVMEHAHNVSASR